MPRKFDLNAHVRTQITNVLADNTELPPGQRADLAGKLMDQAVGPWLEQLDRETDYNNDALDLPGDCPACGVMGPGTLCVGHQAADDTRDDFKRLLYVLADNDKLITTALAELNQKGNLR